MKKQHLMLLFLVITTGCLGGQLKVHVDVLDNITSIAIVPMESPPLSIFPTVSTDSLFVGSTKATTIPVESVQQAGAIGVFVSGIFMLVELPSGMKESAKQAASFDAVINRGEVWIPTVMFAREAANQITSKVKYNVVIQEVRKFPGLTNRGRTFFMENWMKPIRDWHKADQSIFDYSSLEKQGFHAVLEVGMLGYGYTGDFVTLDVMFKLIDARTGRVIGRSVESTYTETDKGEPLLANDGKNFKELIGSLGSELIDRNMRSIGLISE